MEQALLAVQSLQPTGVGARTLPECLILQLALGKNFNVHRIGLVRDGLEVLAKNDLGGIAKLLGTIMLGAKAAAVEHDPVARIQYRKPCLIYCA